MFPPARYCDILFVFAPHKDIQTLLKSRWLLLCCYVSAVPKLKCERPKTTQPSANHILVPLHCQRFFALMMRQKVASFVVERVAHFVVDGKKGGKKNLGSESVIKEKMD